MKTFFPLTYRHVRITDILGLDELLAVRGLKEVAVIHAQSKSTNLTVETDRANLSELLTHQLKKDKVCLLGRDILLVMLTSEGLRSSRRFLARHNISFQRQTTMIILQASKV